MAADDLTEIQAASDRYYQNVDPVWQIFTDSVLLYLLWGEKDLDDMLAKPSDFAEGGNKIKVLVAYGKSPRGGYGDTTEIPTDKTEHVQAALFDWGGAVTAETISLKEKIRNTPGASATKADLIKTKIEAMQRSIRDMMGESVYKKASTLAADSTYSLVESNSSAYMDGLESLFNPAGGTAYGALTENNNSWWSPNNPSSETNFNLKTLQVMKRAAAYGASREKRPDIYIASEELVDGFSRSLQSQQRFSDQKLADAGFDNVLFQGYRVTFEDDSKLPSTSTAYALNTKHLRLLTHPDYAFTRPVWEHPYNKPDVATANIRWIGQLTTDKRSAHAKHASLSAQS